MKLRSLFVVLVALFWVTAISGQLPPTQTPVAGLTAEVAVRRDARAIPYIEAANDADLYFMQGWTTASDRLWQMDLMRRLARGETAEIFGAQTLEEDKRWRRFGFSQIADESLGKLTPQLGSALENYARGVNAYIATLDDKTLPVEFRILQYKPRPWTPSDTIVIGKILADALSTTWRNDLMRASLANISKEKFADINNQITPFDVVLFGKDAPSPKPMAMPMSKLQAIDNATLAAAGREDEVRRRSLEMIGLFAEDLAASNNWVISGKRTADGKPILANDPHLSPTAPGIWYLTHLSTPSMRVSGVTFPGVPGIVLGHNRDIAWGATNVGPDVQDLYLETFNEKGEVKTPAGWEPATIVHNEIKVRASALKPDTNVVNYDVTLTRHGPIVVDEGGKRYALKWTARDSANSEFEAFFQLNRARNWDDFKAALSTYGGAAQNFVYADTKGNIGWYAAGRIPLRRTGDGSMPYDGSTNEGDWLGYIPFGELPNLYDPPEGVIVTANQRIVGNTYKYPQISRDVAPPWRARAILNDLNSRTKITADDVRDIQYETFNIPLDALAKHIVVDNGASEATLAVLKAWDGRMTVDSRGAVLANEIRSCIANKMADDNKSIPLFVIRERITDWAVREHVARWLPTGFAKYGELFRACDLSVRTSLADPKRLGPDDRTWTWGRLFQSHFPHPLASAPFIGAQFATPVEPLSGSGQTPDVGSNVSMRYIATPGNWDTTRQVIPLGQSGDPRSPHYKDQFDAWMSGTPMIFPFTKAAVENTAIATTIMTPK